jgi:N-carbamoyl-L-amino-acid hydrolase
LLSPDKICAFIECHIEQGRRLYDQGLSLGVVSTITGIYREKIEIAGEANHAGTTIMNNRRDALLAACEFNLSFEAWIKQFSRDDVVGTVGVLEVSPNSTNIIPGKVEMIVEIRAADMAVTEKSVQKIGQIANRISSTRGVTFQRTVILNQAAVKMDKQVITALHKSVEYLNEPVPDLVSMAGHDAAHIAGVTKTGMLFVQSIEGKSHCPEEKTDIRAIEKAGNALFTTIMILDEELDP